MYFFTGGRLLPRTSGSGCGTVADGTATTRWINRLGHSCLNFFCFSGFFLWSLTPFAMAGRLDAALARRCDAYRWRCSNTRGHPMPSKQTLLMVGTTILAACLSVQQRYGTSHVRCEVISGLFTSHS